jgi:ABC-type transport system involved in multi-copper enzyme maturation permease subunit
MILTLARLTMQECFRRTFPYVATGATLLIIIASRLFLAFTFGKQRGESLNLAISGVFLAGFAVTLFVGTGLVRRDMDRKTLLWLLTKPLGPAQYVAGRVLGLFGANVLAGTIVALGAAPLLVLLSADGPQAIHLADVLAAATRALPPLLVLSAAAVAASAAASRTAAPLLLLALFLVGTLAAGSPASFIAPDFALFSLDANAGTPSPFALVYGLVFCSIFAVTAYIFLAVKLTTNR